MALPCAVLLSLLLAACAPASSRGDPVQRSSGQAEAGSLPSPPSAQPAQAVPATQPVQTPRPDPAQVSAALSSVSPKVALRADSAMTAPLEVTFTASLPAGGSADWHFADGVSASGANVTHTFYQPGRYAVQARLGVGGHEYLATVPIEVRSAGPEQAAAVLLQDAGSVALSAQGSVIYAPYTPQFSLDAQATTPIRHSLQAGIHSVQVSINAASGALSRSYSFRSRAALSSGEASRQQDYESDVLRLSNQARAQGWNCQAQAYGGPALPPLRTDSQLRVAARAQSVGMAVNGYFDHRSAVDGSLPDARVRATGYRPRSDAENIAAGQPTPAAVVTAWLKSPGHCPHIMGDYDDIGVAYIHQDGSPFGDYWTQVFGTRRE